MSEIRATTISDLAGTGPATLTGQYAAKAWVNFNGTGTVAIRQSGNVSSITDNGTGDYTLNFTTAMTDANYSWTGGASYNTLHNILQYRNDLGHAYSTTQLRLHNIRDTGTSDATADSAFLSVTITR